MENPFQIELSDGGVNLSEDSEAYSFMWLLWDRLKYRFGVQHFLPRKNVALLTPDAWHMTPQVEEGTAHVLLRAVAHGTV